MQEKYELAVQDIFEKEFPVDFKGYAPEEVDGYLDMIIRDYQKKDKLIAQYEDEIRQYQYELATLEARVIEAEAALKVAGSTPGNSSNLDILKRLARLEEIVLR